MGADLIQNEDSSSPTADEIIEALQSQVAELQRELSARDDRVADLMKDVAQWRAAVRKMEEAESTREHIDRFTQTFAGPYQAHASTATDESVSARASPTRLSAAGLRARRISEALTADSGVDEDSIRSHRAPPTLTRQYPTPPQLAVPTVVPMLNLLTPRQVAYGGQLSYRAVHQLPNGDYTHASYSPTPREAWSQVQGSGGAGLLRSLETPRISIKRNPLSPRESDDLATNGSMGAAPVAAASPTAAPEATFDIDPEGGCGVCQLSNQALAYLHSQQQQNTTDEGTDLHVPRLAVLRWLVDDLTRLADAHVGFMSGDEQREMMSLLHQLALQNDDDDNSNKAFTPSVPVELDPDALAQLSEVDGTVAVDVKCIATSSAATAPLPGTVWITPQGIAVIAVRGPAGVASTAAVSPPQVNRSPGRSAADDNASGGGEERWWLQALCALRCCFVKCTRSGKEGKFILTPSGAREVAMPPSVVPWATPAFLNSSASNASPAAATAVGTTTTTTTSFLVAMDDVVGLKHHLELVGHTCPHHAFHALRDGAIPLAICANSLLSVSA